MYETLLQEVTGVRLFKEEKAILNYEQCMQLRENVDSFTEEKNKIISEKQICEIYFNSFVEEEAQPEQFLIAIEQKGKKKSIKLKRKSYIGGFGSETAVKLSGEQYRNILQGSMEWMKDSSKMLCNEFYCKIKLFQYKISKIVKCLREEVYLKCQKLQITIDENIKVMYQEAKLCSSDVNRSKAYVCVRTTQGRFSESEGNNLISELLK